MAGQAPERVASRTSTQSRMKAVARSYMWWPGLDKSIENKERSCLQYQAVRHNSPVAPLHPWCWPEKPW